ncbi:hypothetical protein [Peptoniphilus porci]|uniref:Uncharacterized protein n=1 Tax=Peptoniphilus porci TaxID=2652280 RepID=A0A1U7M1M4_9FIRM|nr:hypothetical protein [Peptoniphilus porci]OLR65571.1 hypothetical protein BIV18_08635 [Peptoniphilus porci]
MNFIKIKNILISFLILFSLSLVLVLGIPREKTIIKIKTSYGRNFPQNITYKGEKGLIKYKIDLKLNENNIKKDPNSDKYYAEYSGTIRPEAFTFK